MLKRIVGCSVSMFAVAILLGACSAGEPEQLGSSQSALDIRTCHYPFECNDGEDCINGFCAEPCTTISNCDAGYACTGGACVLPCGLYVNWGTPTAPDCAPSPCRQIYCIEGTICGEGGECYLP